VAFRDGLDMIEVDELTGRFSRFGGRVGVQESSRELIE